MNIDFAIFAAYTFALFGQILDAWTTRVGLDSGRFVEGNGLIRKFIAKHWDVSVAIKAGVLPLLIVPIDMLFGATYSITWGVIYGAFGWVYAVRNYVKLRRANIKLR